MAFLKEAEVTDIFKNDADINVGAVAKKMNISFRLCRLIHNKLVLDGVIDSRINLGIYNRRGLSKKDFDAVKRTLTSKHGVNLLECSRDHGIPIGKLRGIFRELLLESKVAMVTKPDGTKTFKRKVNKKAQTHITKKRVTSAKQASTKRFKPVADAFLSDENKKIKDVISETGESQSFCYGVHDKLVKDGKITSRKRKRLSPKKEQFIKLLRENEEITVVEAAEKLGLNCAYAYVIHDEMLQSSVIAKPRKRNFKQWLITY